MGLQIMAVVGGAYHRSPQEKQNIKGVMHWANTVFPVHLPDADESADGVETDSGFVPAHADVAVLANATGCHDFDCLTTSITCDICEFGGAKSEKIDLTAVLQDIKAVDLLREKSKASKGGEGASFFHHSLREAQFDLYGLVSNSRGSRGRAELRVSGRMGA